MNTLIDFLVEDHRQILRLINSLNFQEHFFSDKNGVNYLIITDILVYLPKYLQQYHHPIEDCLYNILAEKNVLEPSII